MTPTAVALLGFAAWTMLLVGGLAAYRSLVVLRGSKKANEFRPSGEDVGGLGLRLTRAHANCYENLPAAGAIMLYAIATGQTALTDSLAYLFLGARIAQSLVHIASTSGPAVLIRFLLYIVQLAVLTIWLLKLFQFI